MSTNIMQSNLKSDNPTATDSAYLEIANDCSLSYIEIIATTGPLLLSIGHAVPADATSFLIPTGGVYKFDRRIPTGLVAVKSQSGSVQFGLIKA